MYDGGLMTPIAIAKGYPNKTLMNLMRFTAFKPISGMRYSLFFLSSSPSVMATRSDNPSPASSSSVLSFSSWLYRIVVR